MIKGDELSESAKAVQEVAKTTNTALETVNNLGSFVSRVIGQPIEDAVGILGDRIKYTRWERQQRLVQRTDEIIQNKNIEGELKRVPPKLALPIIENASLEENDELQDIWAQLIASAVDPNFDGTLRTAFIDILKQLEVNDVHILNFIYSSYQKTNTILKTRNLRKEELDSNTIPVTRKSIRDELKISELSYKESIDNLTRLGCLASHIEKKK